MLEERKVPEDRAGKFEEARLRALVSPHGERGKGQKPVRLSQKAKRAKVKRALVKKKKRAEMKLFMAEIKAREKEGYSVRQLMRSVVPKVEEYMRDEFPEPNETTFLHCMSKG